MPGQDLPNDFESCGVCGYDHAYEWPVAATEITRIHIEVGDVPEDFEWPHLDREVRR